MSWGDIRRDILELFAEAGRIPDSPTRDENWWWRPRRAFEWATIHRRKITEPAKPREPYVRKPYVPDPIVAKYDMSICCWCGGAATSILDTRPYCETHAKHYARVRKRTA